MNTMTPISTLLRRALYLWLTWESHLIRRSKANGKRQTSRPGVFPQPWPSDQNRTEICKTSTHPAPRTANIFRNNSQKEGRGRGKRQREKGNKGTAIDNSLPFAFSASGLGSAEREGCSRHFFCKCACERARVQRTHVRVYHFYTRVQPGLRVGEFTGDMYILCAYLRQKKKRLQTVKIYCTVKLAKIMTTVRKKIMRAKFGSGGRILWCLDSNLTPDWVLRIKWTKYIIHPKSACQR